jgi:hypothetical protein
VEYKGKPVELTARHIDKAVEGLRAKWKKDHPKAKEGEGPFPYVTRVVVRRDGAAVPQTLLVRFADGSSRTLRWDADEGDRWGRWRFVTRSRAVSVELDPERRVFLDRDKLDDSRTREADGSASRRWTADLAAVVQSFYALLGTL